MKLYILKTVATVKGDAHPSALYFSGEKKNGACPRHMFAHSQKYAVRFPSKRQAEEQAKVIGGAVVVRLMRRREADSLPDAKRIENLERLFRESTPGEWCMLDQGKDQDSHEHVAYISSELKDGSREPINYMARVGGGHAAAICEEDARLIVAMRSELTWLISMAKRAAA